MSKKDSGLNAKITDLKFMIDWFYSDDFSLEEVTDRYKRTLELAKTVEKDLEDLKNEITILSEKFSE
jgi:Exonuclease VII small subunit.